MAITESEIREAYTRLVSLCQAIDRKTLPLLGHDTAGAVASRGWTVESLLAQTQLNIETLEGAGMIIERDGNDEIHPSLAVAGALLQPLRAAADAPVFDILTGQGTLSGEVPLFATMGDYVTKENITQSDEHELVLAFDLRDVIVCRSWSLAATMAAGLDSLRGPGLRRVADMLRRDGGGASNSQTVVPAGEEISDSAPLEDAQDAVPRLAFVAWSPGCGSLVRPVSMVPVLRHWIKLGELVDLPFDEVGVWETDDDLLHRIGLLIDLEAWPELTEIAFEDLTRAQYLSGFEFEDAPAAPEVVPTFAQSQDAFIDELVIGNNFAEHQEATATFRAAIHRYLADPECPHRDELNPLARPLLEIVLLMQPMVTAGFLRDGLGGADVAKERDMQLMTLTRALKEYKGLTSEARK